MAPKFSRSPDISQRSSILVQDVDPDDIDIGECWIGRGASSAPHWRNAYSEKKASSSFTWGSRFSSISSNARSAGATIATRAKQLRIPTSFPFAFSRLRKPVTKLPRAASMPDQQVLIESDLDDLEGQPEPEDDNYDPKTGKTRPKLHLSHTWTQGYL